MEWLMRTLLSDKTPRHYGINLYKFFLVLYMGMYVFPFLYIIYVDELDIHDGVVKAHFYASLIYLFGYSAFGVLAFAVGERGIVAGLLNREYNFYDHALRSRLVKIAKTIGVLACLVIFIYYASGGYRKMFMLGSNVDSSEFRLIGYDDVNRYLTAVFEFARRVVMPFVLATLYL
ncbi:MAG: hypothetical protein AAB276_07475, partial [Pseudomonadota bacterium]